MPEEEFRDRMDEELDRLKALPPASGFAGVSYPGEREWHTARERSADGIPFASQLVEDLKGAWRHLFGLVGKSAAFDRCRRAISVRGWPIGARWSN